MRSEFSVFGMLQLDSGTSVNHLAICACHFSSLVCLKSEKERKRRVMVDA